jgi:hypothetical protein
MGRNRSIKQPQAQGDVPMLRESCVCLGGLVV